jgi:hypothetical protein
MTPEPGSLPAPGFAPELSVVIVAGARRDRVERALRSVLEQECTRPLEVIVIDLDGTAAGEGPSPPDPRLRWIQLPPRLNFGEARAEAIALARGKAVAFLEEHCLALPGWADSLARAHDEPWACVGAEVHSMNPGRGWSDAVYLLGYSQWMPPVAPGPVPSTAAHNSSYKVACLQPLCDRLPELLLVEPLLQGELSRMGHSLYLEPGARFAHENETGLKTLGAYYWWNRCYGRIRARVTGWTLSRRVAYTVLSPLAPWVRIARLARHLIRRRDGTFRRFAVQAPRILVLHAVATFGMVAGLWVGGPRDDARFTDLELRGDHDR